MSSEAFQSFLKRCAEDAEFTKNMRSFTDVESFVKAANDAGYAITVADWLKSQAEKTLELSDEELEKAAGGATVAEATGVVIKTLSFAVGGDCMPDKSGQAGSFAHWSC